MHNIPVGLRIRRRPDKHTTSIATKSAPHTRHITTSALALQSQHRNANLAPASWRRPDKLIGVLARAIALLLGIRYDARFAVPVLTCCGMHGALTWRPLLDCSTLCSRQRPMAPL